MYLVAAHRLYCIYRKAWEQLDSALVYIGEGYGSPPASSPLLRPLYSALPGAAGSSAGSETPSMFTSSKPATWPCLGAGSGLCLPQRTGDDP